MRARYYCPTLRRFVNADKVHGDITNALTLNRYSFCNGDPANGVDPMGLSADNARGQVNYNGVYVPSPSIRFDDEDYFDLREFDHRDDIINYYAMLAEHKKRGTTNPANLPKHEKGQARKKKDNKGEKGDARREDRSNKNKNKNKNKSKHFNAEDVLNGVIITAEVVIIAYLLLNDLSGAGTADDFMIPCFYADMLARI